jgi:hypothetical protein
MVAAGFVMIAPFYLTTQRHIPDEKNLHIQ